MRNNLETGYYPELCVFTASMTRSYDKGVRIASNSWGLSLPLGYITMCRKTDSFLWRHNDMTVLFAAGNEGEDG